MKGGIITVIGFLLIILVVALTLAVITCTTPASRGSPLCEPLEPLFSLLSSLGF